jgi:hypothetical protein
MVCIEASGSQAHSLHLVLFMFRASVAWRAFCINMFRPPVPTHGDTKADAKALFTARVSGDN